MDVRHGRSRGRGDTMDTQQPILNEGGERPPRPQTPEDDCPICFGALGEVAPLCPNGHKVCAICRPHIVRSGGAQGPRCPLCRHPLAREAGPMPPRDAVVVVPNPELDALLQAGRDAHRAWVAQNAPNRNARGRQVAHVGGEDALGRRGGGRPHRGADWDAARERFLAHREAGRIPPETTFGGIHERKCGHRGCVRVGGQMGVRFLLFGDSGKRRYRCEEHTHE